MLKKLRNSLLRLNIILLAIVIILSFSIIYYITWHSLEGEIENRLRAVPPNILSNLLLSELQGLDEDTPGEIRINDHQELPIDYSRTFIANINANGEIRLVISRIDLTQDDYATAVRLALESGGNSGSIKLAGKTWAYLITGGRNSNIVFMDAQSIRATQGRILISMGILAMVVLSILFFISYFFANRAIRPVEESINRQRRFISDASHELKTPLAIINSNAEAMLIDGTATVSSQRKWLDRIEEESDRMNKLIEGLLYLARSEEGGTDESLPMDLSEAAEVEINRVEAVLFERGIRLTFRKYTGPLIVKADAEKIRQAILILLDNAVKYTDKGGEVVVETGCGRNHGYLKMSNTGQGIPAEDLPHIFDRFYRVDKSRSSNGAAGFEGSGRKSGYGLGLAIAQNIVERDRGHIKATVAAGMTTFTIELPLHAGTR
jgi:signal transduction histidine kinase